MTCLLDHMDDTVTLLRVAYKQILIFEFEFTLLLVDMTTDCRETGVHMMSQVCPQDNRFIVWG